MHVVLERLARHVRDQLSQHEVPEVRVRGLGTGSEPHTAVAFQQTFDEAGSVRSGLVGPVDPSQRHRVGQTGAVSEQMAGGDRRDPLCWSQHRQRCVRVDDRRIEIEPTIVCELDHGGRRDQLRHREPVADALRRHVVVTAEIGGPERSLEANAVGVDSDHRQARHNVTNLGTRSCVQPDCRCSGPHTPRILALDQKRLQRELRACPFDQSPIQRRPDRPEALSTAAATPAPGGV